MTHYENAFVLELRAALSKISESSGSDFRDVGQRFAFGLMRSLGEWKSGIYSVPDGKTSLQCEVVLFAALSEAHQRAKEVVSNMYLTAQRLHDESWGTDSPIPPPYGLDYDVPPMPYRSCVVKCGGGDAAQSIAAAASCRCHPMVVVGLFAHEPRKHFGSVVDDSVDAITAAVDVHMPLVAITPVSPENIRARLRSMWRVGAALDARVGLLDVSS